MGKMLSRDDVLKAQDMRTETVHVPEWDGDVIVRTLRGDEYEHYEESLLGGRGRSRHVIYGEIRAKLLVACIVNENGDRVFTEKDIDALKSKSAAALDRVWTVAQRLNGLSAEDIEGLAKNYGADRSDDSGSD